MAQADPHTHVHANTPCSPQDVDAFLEEAEAMAARRGQRMTKIRRKVLRLLLESEEPSKAYDLLANLDGEGAAKPPTIYRALDFLQEAGLAHKIESLNAYVACGHTSHKHSAVFLICEECGAAEELHAVATNEALRAETEAAGFRMRQAVIEARGVCRDCAD
ncbi:MAG: transcriptional repressor [Henriciella sp.]|jgi:Fur family zinc uptake transcriptional regulator|uniref:transcriptional repressor n=1 Tax=Henriciella sp. TaxID=1968823 RepID=UPI000C0E4C15|nr:transcriptional repressor [Henriciella sp.]MAN75454.1 transcriptional repressor [Henriciella sp.]MBF34984.1 transcriptional repressor [Hyphomonadaceae bacterium]PHR75055.1 MAG: transcriptional repressor [Henriciella sp.]|tara:strand:+ start:1365 stop:1850 length:486 start_codon:yes stop_codon:yes gene_type:complete